MNSMGKKLGHFFQKKNTTQELGSSTFYEEGPDGL